jgi:1-acyl-sn-glycerol-3-phosphate acyltransferase
MMETAGAKRRTEVALPPRSERLFRWFRWYARRYCAKHLHAVRLARWGMPPRIDGPAIVVMNHPSWWDPLIAFVLSELFENREHWGVIEAEALKQYRFLGRAGMIGVRSQSPGEAARFLQSARTILENPRSMLWITGHGRFADIRKRSLRLKSGVGALARESNGGVVVPLALEMPFWDQRTPEALAAFGEPIDCREAHCQSRDEWTAEIGQALESVQDRLAEDSQSRDPDRFETVVQGRTGVGGVYDVWRRMTAWVRGERFNSDHR